MYIPLYPCKKGTGMTQQWEDAATVTWKLDQETSQIIRQETLYPHNAQSLRQQTKSANKIQGKSEGRRGRRRFLIFDDRKRWCRGSDWWALTGTSGLRHNIWSCEVDSLFWRGAGGKREKRKKKKAMKAARHLEAGWKHTAEMHHMRIRWKQILVAVQGAAITLRASEASLCRQRAARHRSHSRLWFYCRKTGETSTLSSSLCSHCLPAFVPSAHDAVAPKFLSGKSSAMSGNVQNSTWSRLWGLGVMKRRWSRAFFFFVSPQSWPTRTLLCDASPARTLFFMTHS